jgi:hypothetical protein
MPGNQNCVGTVIQSYLKRSESDVEKLLAEGIRIRLCKGAYKEPASIAFESKADVDANYVKLMKILMKSGIYHGLATHDENIIKEGASVRHARKDRAQFFRISDAIRHSPRPAAELWCAMAGACASTSPSAPSGIPTSCGGWASARRMCFFIARNLLRN